MKLEILVIAVATAAVASKFVLLDLSNCSTESDEGFCVDVGGRQFNYINQCHFAHNSHKHAGHLVREVHCEHGQDGRNVYTGVEIQVMDSYRHKIHKFGVQQMIDHSKMDHSQPMVKGGSCGADNCQLNEVCVEDFLCNIRPLPEKCLETIHCMPLEHASHEGHTTECKGQCPGQACHIIKQGNCDDTNGVAKPACQKYKCVPQVDNTKTCQAGNMMIDGRCVLDPPVKPNPENPPVQPAVCGNAMCPAVYDPVCANNGKTYGNKCIFNTEQCQNTSLNVLYRGPCASDNFKERCRQQCTKGQGCLRKKDGSVECRDSLCKACRDDQSCTVIRHECTNVCTMPKAECKDGETPVRPITDKPVIGDPSTPSNNWLCSMALKCIDVFNPVCGTDGNTYENPCALKRAQQCGTKVNRKRSGQCTQADVDSKVSDPGTITDPETDSGKIPPDDKPETSVDFCSNKQCSDEKKPVCDQDGNQYPNQCVFQKALCAGGSMFETPCPDMPKPTCSTAHCMNGPLQPVCGKYVKEGIITYLTEINACFLQNRQCENPQLKIDAVAITECQENGVPMPKVTVVDPSGKPVDPKDFDGGKHNNTANCYAQSTTGCQATGILQTAVCAPENGVGSTRRYYNGFCAWWLAMCMKGIQVTESLSKEAIPGSCPQPCTGDSDCSNGRVCRGGTGFGTKCQAGALGCDSFCAEPLQKIDLCAQMKCAGKCVVKEESCTETGCETSATCQPADTQPSCSDFDFNACVRKTSQSQDGQALNACDLLNAQVSCAVQTGCNDQAVDLCANGVRFGESRFKPEGCYVGRCGGAAPDAQCDRQGFDQCAGNIVLQDCASFKKLLSECVPQFKCSGAAYCTMFKNVDSTCDFGNLCPQTDGVRTTAGSAFDLGTFTLPKARKGHSMIYTLLGVGAGCVVAVAVASVVILRRRRQSVETPFIDSL